MSAILEIASFNEPGIVSVSLTLAAVVVVFITYYTLFRPLNRIRVRALKHIKIIIV